MSEEEDGKKKTKKKKQTYEEKMKKTRDLQRAKTAAGQEIGKVPKVKHKKRKEVCEFDFEKFCTSYFPDIFCLPWSPDHEKVISRIETSTLKGGLFGIALPRGYGKSSLVETGAIWALLYGHRKFICMIGSDAGLATDMLTSIKSAFEHEDELFKDFPEVCHPIWALDGNSKRTIGQTCDGMRTEIRWTGKTIVLPNVRDSIASGSVIKTAGITGGIRGMKHKLADGRIIRPDFVIIDDPQTDESAESPKQIEDRLKVISKSILYLPGPKVKISGFMPCTVIAPDDLADQILNRDLYPEWQGLRVKMLPEFPSDMELWEEYNKIRIRCLKDEGQDDITEATEFYSENREEMDRGAVVSWPEKFNEEDEISGLQHAMNLFFMDEDAFYSEAQNNPRRKAFGDISLMSKDEIAAKINKHDRNVVPGDASKITAFIDVQQKILFYCVVAWEDDGTSYVIDYGTYPDQNKDHFAKNNIKQSYLVRDMKGGFEAKLYLALKELSERLLSKSYSSITTEEMKIDLLMIDANWHQSTKTVIEFCRKSDFAKQLKPSFGKYYGAAQLPMAEAKIQKGDRKGLNWRQPNPKGKYPIRYVIYDTNFWKMWIHERFQTPEGGSGCLSLFGVDPKKHRLFSEHMVSEFIVLTEGRGRKVTEFKDFPNRPDNDWLDCIVGAAVAASIVGVKLKGVGDETPKKEKTKRKMSEILAEKRKNRGL